MDFAKAATNFLRIQIDWNAVKHECAEAEGIPGVPGDPDEIDRKEAGEGHRIGRVRGVSSHQPVPAQVEWHERAHAEKEASKGGLRVMLIWRCRPADPVTHSNAAEAIPKGGRPLMMLSPIPNEAHG